MPQRTRHHKTDQRPILHLSQRVGVAAGQTDFEQNFKRHVVSVKPVTDNLSA